MALIQSQLNERYRAKIKRERDDLKLECESLKSQIAELEALNRPADDVLRAKLPASRVQQIHEWIGAQAKPQKLLSAIVMLAYERLDEIAGATEQEQPELVEKQPHKSLEQQIAEAKRKAGEIIAQRAREAEEWRAERNLQSASEKENLETSDAELEKMLAVLDDI